MSCWLRGWWLGALSWLAESWQVHITQVSTNSSAGCETALTINWPAEKITKSTKINKMCSSKAISLPFPVLLPYFISPFVPTEVNFKFKECMLHDTALGFLSEPRAEIREAVGIQFDPSTCRVCNKHIDSAQPQGELKRKCDIVDGSGVAEWIWIHQLSSMWVALPLQALHLAVHTGAV